nr:hypothetical protein [Methylobacterium sp. J-067]
MIAATGATLVDRELTALSVDESPVDSEPTWLVVVELTAYSWLPFTASVDVALNVPDATFVILCADPPRPAS